MYANIKKQIPGMSNYYAHIDGLRCLAVLPVVLYHLYAPLFPGGFLGVDIFFVISGYLICGGIFRDLEAERFTLKSFYYRRIRRIFPAYFALVTGVLLVGMLLYHWGRLLPLAQTALAGTAFSANLYFWLTMGYFQPTAHENPLLHLWSLGVEEQFYIVIPLLLPFLWRFMRSATMAILLVGSLLSLLLCIVLGHAGESTTAFYILPTRAWELLAGALICRLPDARPSSRASVLGLVGLLLVIVSYFSVGTGGTFGQAGTNVGLVLFGQWHLVNAPFPGWINVPVIIGTMLLIRYGGHGIIGRLLSSWPCIGVGKISYSLYLWHWPVFVFGSYIAYGHMNAISMVVVLILSFVLAYVSWRWIEMPVRLSKTFSVRKAFTTSAIGCMAVVGICAVLIMTEGLRVHVHKEANKYAPEPYPFTQNFDKFLPSKAPFKSVASPEYDESYVEIIGDKNEVPKFFLFGDSHAESIMPGLDIVGAEQGRAGYYLKHHIDPYIRENSGTMKIFEWIASRDEVEVVYIVDRWLHQYGVEEGVPKLGDKGKIQKVVLSPSVEEEFRGNFGRTLKWWRERGKRVVVFSSVPEYHYTPGDVMARSQIIPTSILIGITEQDYYNRQAPVTKVFSDMLDGEWARFVPLGEAFLENGNAVFMASDGLPYYRDGDHVTHSGAEKGARYIQSMLWDKKD